MAADTKNLPEVHGYLAGNWPDCNADNPAVMLNPSAQPLDLLAWCWGELMSLTAVADALVAGDAEHCGDTFGPVFVQRLPAVRDVLEHAVNRMYAERHADQLASQQAGDSTVRPHIVRTGGDSGP